MPIQIDHMETSIEIAPPTAAAMTPAAPVTAPASVPSQAALGDAVGRVLADELDRFLRNRGG